MTNVNPSTSEVNARECLGFAVARADRLADLVRGLHALLEHTDGQAPSEVAIRAAEGLVIEASAVVADLAHLVRQADRWIPCADEVRQ